MFWAFILRQSQFNCSKPSCQTVKKKKKSIKEENVSSGVFKWNVTLYFLPATKEANCCFNEETLNANRHSRKYRAEADTYLIIFICALSAFTESAMAAHLVWVHILGHWRCFLGRDEAARNNICCFTPTRVFMSHTTCQTTWTWLFRAAWLDREQIGKESQKEIPSDVSEKCLLPVWSLSDTGNAGSWKAAEGNPDCC